MCMYVHGWNVNISQLHGIPVTNDIQRTALRACTYVGEEFIVVKYTYIWMDIHTYVYKDIGMHMYSCIDQYINIYICMNTNMHIYVYIYMYIYICINIHIYIHIYIYV